VPDVTGEPLLDRWLPGDPGNAGSATGGTSAGRVQRLRSPLADPVAARLLPGNHRVSMTPGQVFASFRIERELGRGAMAAVYKARDERDGRVVALKLLSLGDDWPDDQLDEARLRMRREAEAAARIQHPDIVSVYEAGEHAGLVYLALEFVQGVSLDAHSCEGRLLPPRMVTGMCARVADALHFAHQRGIVHRDIKPANIVFDQQSRRIRVMDFGVARFSDSRATRTGVVLGSPSYMAPEQLDGGTVTGQSDLFSLGVTLYQLLTGQLPFRADSMPGLMQAVVLHPHPPLWTIRPDLPKPLAGALDRALHKEPAARFESAAHMGQALRDCVQAIDPGLR
jgi:serine/threonine-protein kinase